MLPSAVPSAVAKFLAGEGAVGLEAEGTKLVGRYHTAGSGKGWLVVETSDPKQVYEHASHWGGQIAWEVHPVFTDEEAGAICAKVWGKKE